MALRITIHGSYGTGNRGDNYILFQLLGFLERETPGAEVTVLCRDEERLGALLESEFSETSLILRTLHHSFKRRTFAVIKACMACDMFILGGGGLLWGKASGNLGYWLLRLRLAMLAGRKTVIYAPGIFNIQGHRAETLLARVASKVDFLSVRDKLGFDILRAVGVSEQKIFLGADPVFLVPPPDPQRGEELRKELKLTDRKIIGLSARDWSGRLSAGLFARVVAELASDDDTFLIFFALKDSGMPTEVDRDDTEVGRRLLLTLDPEMQKRMLILDDSTSSEDFMALVSICDFLIGMRLHALIMATLAGVPFGALTYDHKVEAYMAMIGRQEYLVDRTRFSDPSALDDLVVALKALLDQPRSIVQTPIMIAGAEMAGRARAMHQELAARLRDWFPDA
ncbi:polysaccharide pyruvyl transferase family protein [bacterium]|nr:polysaccharide pyruvyl transferase family protein [bacterium]